MRIAEMLFFLFISATAGAEQNFVLFTEEEVRTNVVDFINVVFGEKRPTFADYLHFEGQDPGPEAELVAAVPICRNVETTTNQRRQAACATFLNDRYERSNNVESLYYKKLRHELRITQKSIELSDVSCDAPNECLATAVVRATGMKLTFSHAKYQALAELRLVTLIAVDGKPTAEALGRTKRFGRIPR